MKCSRHHPRDTQSDYVAPVYINRAVCNPSLCRVPRCPVNITISPFGNDVTRLRDCSPLLARNSRPWRDTGDPGQRESGPMAMRRALHVVGITEQSSGGRNRVTLDSQCVLGAGTSAQFPRKIRAVTPGNASSPLRPTLMRLSRR